MYKLGNVLGVLGIIVCILAVIGRFIGEESFMGFQAVNVFVVGMAFMMMGIFAKVSGK